MKKSIWMGILATVAVGATAWAADGMDSGASSTTNSATDKVVSLPAVVVQASRVPAPAQELPVGVSAVGGTTITEADLRTVKDASAYAPNVSITEFSVRQLSVPYVRGIGASPGNPAVSTCYDGVPQLHGYSANRELLDVRQIEFVRGPQATLYGRNALAGAINVESRRPSRAWQVETEGSLGNFSAQDARLSVSGPLDPGKVGLGLAAGYASRDGYTVNDFTGHDIDDRQAWFGKAQLEFTPAEEWSARLIVSGERDRDGDYALGDLSDVRARPHHVSRDFEGYARRDIVSPTLLLEHYGQRVDTELISGYVGWKSDTITDLDYTTNAVAIRSGNLKGRQFTEELRFSSPEDAPIELSQDWALKWQAGLLLFSQDYNETSVNSYAAVPPLIPFPVEQTSPMASLDDYGAGLYGQAIVTAHEKTDFGFGLRGDYEHKHADLLTSYSPPIAPDTVVDATREFSEVTPQFSIAHHFDSDKMVYGTVGRGYRAGGFNPVSPAGSEAYGEETSWNYETGLKTGWFDNRFDVNLAAFYTDWNNLQLNLPVGQNYYIDNAGDAYTTGVELELSAKPLPEWELFGGIGQAAARFKDGATSIHTDAIGANTAVDVGGNHLPYAPDFTAHAGTQYTWPVAHGAAVYARAEAVAYGRYFYNAANTAEQPTYTLADFRAGVRGDAWFIEGWVRNAFDKDYVPVAFEFPNGQSGFIGEAGAPATFGVRAGLVF